MGSRQSGNDRIKSKFQFNITEKHGKEVEILTLEDAKTQPLNTGFSMRQSINDLYLESSDLNLKFGLQNNASIRSVDADSAESTKSFEILIGSGISFPFYDPIKESQRERYITGFAPIPENWFWDYWDLGYILEFGAGYNFAPKLTGSLLFDLSSYSLDMKEYRKSFGYGTDEIIPTGKTSILTITANMKTDVSELSYFNFGMGMYTFTIPDIKTKSTAVTPYPHFSTYTVEEIDTGFSETGFTIGAGWGIQAQLGNIKPFLQIDYFYFFMKEENVSYFPIKAGLMYKF
ncbi:MAG: hypothetical protein IPG02_02400 [Ignavibacteria bacterium]|nr:hypothetical protein [Ignavibacteria bacterium]